MENESTRGELVRIAVRELRLHRQLRMGYRKAATLSRAAQAFVKGAEVFAVEREGRYCSSANPDYRTALQTTSNQVAGSG